MQKKLYRLRSKLWQYPGMAGWHFVTINKVCSVSIKKQFGTKKRGWGSLPVLVKVGKTNWNTSIFPDSTSGTYLLPVKATVRKAEGLFAGEDVDFSLKILA